MSSPKDKGKGPENPTDKDNNIQPPPPSQSDQDNPSLLSRITASASALSQSAFIGPPTRNELHATAQSALPNAGKASNIPGASGSGSGNSAFAESSRTQQQRQQPSHVKQGGFRGGMSDAEDHTSLSEREFSSFLDGINSFTPSVLSQEQLPGADGLDIHKSHYYQGEGNDTAFNDAWNRSQHGTLQTSNYATGTTTTVQEQQQRDGEEVLAILSTPDIYTEEQFSVDEERPPPNWGLSPEQISQIRTLMSEIFPAEPSQQQQQQHVVPSPENPLNLAPAFETSGLETEEEALQAREHWREQWEGVLTRYTDEVWGGLLPLVKEARKEVEDMRVEQKPVDETPKALRRLGAILGHLRNSGGL